MRARSRSLSLALLFAGLASSAALGGCYHHHYDSGYRWAPAEEPYYERWETETRREHRDYNQRSQDEQRAYWQWRQSHQQ